MYNSWVETEDWSRQDWAKMEGHKILLSFELLSAVDDLLVW
jgi:hypothetical protein